MMYLVRAFRFSDMIEANSPEEAAKIIGKRRWLHVTELNKIARGAYTVGKMFKF